MAQKRTLQDVYPGSRRGQSSIGSTAIVVGGVALAAGLIYSFFFGGTAKAATPVSPGLYIPRQPAPAQPGYQAPPFIPGQQSPIDRVDAQQNALNLAGFGPLAVDGIRGSAMIAATKEFQRSRGLVVDGLIGPLTKSALMDVAIASEAIHPAV